MAPGRISAASGGFRNDFGDFRRDFGGFRRLSADKGDPEIRFRVKKTALSTINEVFRQQPCLQGAAGCGRHGGERQARRRAQARCEG